MRRLLALALAAHLACAPAPAAPDAEVLMDARLDAVAEVLAPSWPRACPAQRYEATAELRALGSLGFDDAGVTPSLALSQGARFLAVDLGVATRCAQVHSLSAADGGLLVEPGDFGLYCQRCLQRSSVLEGSGYFALPSDATQLGASALSLTLRNCAFGGSLLPLPPGARVALAELALQDRPLPRRGVLELALQAFSDTWLAGATAEQLRDFEAQVGAELADAGLAVRVAARCATQGAPGTVALEVGDVAPLVALRAPSGSACESAVAPWRVTVWSARCVQLHDAVLGQRTSPEGWTTHIPGGHGSPATADGVLLSDGCVAWAPGQMPPHLPRVLAHELGHYLGLYHSVETDGRADLLADTDERNLMNAVATLAVARGLSAQQAVIARRHPSVRWPLAGAEECAAP